MNVCHGSTLLFWNFRIFLEVTNLKVEVQNLKIEVQSL